MSVYCEEENDSRVNVYGIFHSPSPEHLGKDAADAPQVHWRGVTGLEQHLRGSVPQRYHLDKTRQLEFDLGHILIENVQLMKKMTAISS